MNPTYFEELRLKGLSGPVFRSRMPASLYDIEVAEKILPVWQINGITHVVCLQLEDEMERYAAMHLPTEFYPDQNLDCLWHPILDHHGSSTPSQLLDDAIQINSLISKGTNVVIHCHAGVGRTGMFIAAMLISIGFTVDDAIINLRNSSSQLKHSVNQDQRDCLQIVAKLKEGMK